MAVFLESLNSPLSSKVVRAASDRKVTGLRSGSRSAGSFYTGYMGSRHRGGIFPEPTERPPAGAKTARRPGTTEPTAPLTGGSGFGLVAWRRLWESAA